MWRRENPMDTHSCWIPASLPFGVVCSIVLLGHICTDWVILLRCYLCDCSSAWSNFLHRICRNTGDCAGGSMAFCVDGKPFWNVLIFFFPFVSSHLCLCFSKEVLSLKAANKGAFLPHEILIWVIFKSPYSFYGNTSSFLNFSKQIEKLK